MADNEKGRRDRREQDQDELGIDWKAAWETEDNYWEENFSSRPYALGPDAWDRVAGGRTADSEVRHPQIRE